MENADQPAYPQSFASDIDGSMFTSSEKHSSNAGMSKREYFAGLAMQGILSNIVLLAEMQKDYGADVDNQIAYNAIETADALLKALEHDQPQKAS